MLRLARGGGYCTRVIMTAKEHGDMGYTEWMDGMVGWMDGCMAVVTRPRVVFS